MAGNNNSGRRPSPTKLKVLRGVARVDRLNHDEPTPPDGPVERPGYLSAGAVVAWDEEAPAAIAMGTLTSADRRAFGAMCELIAAFQANVGRDEPSPTVTVNIANSLRPYFDYFGLNPSGRSRIRIPKPEEPASKWA